MTTPKTPDREWVSTSQVTKPPAPDTACLGRPEDAVEDGDADLGEARDDSGDRRPLRTRRQPTTPITLKPRGMTRTIVRLTTVDGAGRLSWLDGILGQVEAETSAHEQ